jgi:polar amino acid transport system substrate-binding protein
MSNREDVLAEIAPTGVIRAAVNMSNAALIRWDEHSCGLIGPSVRIAHAIAEGLDIGISLQQYSSAADILAAADAREWDVAFIASDPSRADLFAFSPPYFTVEATYLVAEGSTYRSSASIDAGGVQVAAAKSAAYTKQLERMLKNARILYAESPRDALDLLYTARCDAAAGLTEFLIQANSETPGFRLVEDAFSKIPQTVAVHGQFDHAASYLTEFVHRFIGANSGE